jgi:hypothetical protein
MPIRHFDDQHPLRAGDLDGNLERQRMARSEYLLSTRKGKMM